MGGFDMRHSSRDRKSTRLNSSHITISYAVFCLKKNNRSEETMRTVFTGGTVFDGTGAPPAEADLVIEDGRIVELGPGLDGDESVDVSGQALLPGLFYCHIHVAMRNEDLDELAVMHRPFSYPFYRIAETLRWILSLGITTVRDASGADAGLRQAVEDGVLVGPRMQISVNMISMTGGHSET